MAVLLAAGVASAAKNERLEDRVAKIVERSGLDPSRGLVAWWPLGKDLVDSVNKIKLTPKEKPEFAKRSMVFNGGSQFLSAPADKRLDMGKSDFTLEAVFKLSKDPRKSHGHIIGKAGDKKYRGTGYFLALFGAGYIRARIADSASPQNSVTVHAGLVQLMINEWYHVIASYDRDGDLSVYINGRLAGKSDISKVGDIDNAAPFRIGTLWKQYFPGNIADVRVYKRALSASDAAGRFKAVVKLRGDVFARIKVPDTRHLKWESISETEAAKTTGVTKGNLLSDSSFEGLVGIKTVRNGPKWWAVGGAIVRKGALHGTTCVKRRVVSDPIPYKPGVPHTLSFYARDPKGGDATVRVRHSHGLQSYQIKAGKVVPKLKFKRKLTDKWKRYSFTFRPGLYLEVRNQNLVIEINGGTEALFDALQLEHGGLTDYRPKSLELFVNIPRREDRSFMTYFFEGEKIPLRTVAAGQGPSEISATLTVRDFWMNPVHSRKVTFKSFPGAVSAEAAISLPAFPKGSYRVYLEAQGVKSRSIVFGVISRRLRKGAEIMGASRTAGMDRNKHFTDDFGITWTRDRAAYFGPSSSRPNIDLDDPRYFDQEDSELAQKRKNPKLRYWTSFSKVPSKWAKYRYGTQDPVEEAFLRDSAEHLRKMVRKYGNVVKYWECLNEPSGWAPPEYMKVLKMFSKTVKEADPDAVVVGFSCFLNPTGVLSGDWDRWTVPLLKMGALKYCDVFSFHGYFFADSRMGTYDWAEDKLFGNMTLAEYLDFIRAEARKVGKPDIPIWDNELTLWGESWYDDERPRAVPLRNKKLSFNYRRAVSQIIHYVTIGYAHGVRQFGPHCFTQGWSTQFQHHIEYIQPATDYDGSVKPRTIAYAVVCHKMNDAKLAAERIKGDLHVYTFSKPAGSLAVVFMRHGKKAKLDLPDTKDLEFRNVFDAPFASVAINKDGGTVLSMVGDPVYIESTLSVKEMTLKLDRMKPVE